MIIATRLLKLREGGRDIEVPVRFYKPKEEDGNWSYRFEIDWPDEPEAMSMHGGPCRPGDGARVPDG